MGFWWLFGRQSMQDVRVLIRQQKGLIWGYKKEEKEGSLLLFRGCANSVVNHNIENNITPKKKKKIEKNTLGTYANHS